MQLRCRKQLYGDEKDISHLSIFVAILQMNIVIQSASHVYLNNMFYFTVACITWNDSSIYPYSKRIFPAHYTLIRNIRTRSIHKYRCKFFFFYFILFYSCILPSKRITIMDFFYLFVCLNMFLTWNMRYYSHCIHILFLKHIIETEMLCIVFHAQSYWKKNTITKSKRFV